MDGWWGAIFARAMTNANSRGGPEKRRAAWGLHGVMVMRNDDDGNAVDAFSVSTLQKTLCKQKYFFKLADIFVRAECRRTATDARGGRTQGVGGRVAVDVATMALVMQN